MMRKENLKRRGEKSLRICWCRVMREKKSEEVEECEKNRRRRSRDEAGPKKF